MDKLVFKYRTGIVESFNPYEIINRARADFELSGKPVTVERLKFYQASSAYLLNFVSDTWETILIIRSA